MEKQEFDALFTEHVTASLLDLGFRQRGKSLFREVGWSTLALLAEAAIGEASFVVALRHAFVRIYATEAIPMAGPGSSEEYPFVVPISMLTARNLGMTGSPSVPPVLDISLQELESSADFTAPSSLQAIAWRTGRRERVVAQLREVARRLRTVGVPWADATTPAIALAYLEMHTAKEHKDQFWREEYARFVSSHTGRG